MKKTMLLAAISALAVTAASAQTQLQLAQANIKHVIMIVQENRSFDHYFGMYPGANGIPVDASGNPTTCFPQLNGTACLYPFRDRHNINAGSGHGSAASIEDIGETADASCGNKATWPMMGSVCNQQEHVKIASFCSVHPAAFCIAARRNDSIGYHDRSDLPNYYAYADHFVLEDGLSSGAPSWSGTNHLDEVSAWAASCTSTTSPMTCTDNITQKNDMMTGAHFAWSSLFDALDASNINWKYYVTEGQAPDCDDDEEDCPPDIIGPNAASYWVTPPGFTYFQQQNAASPAGAYSAKHMAKIGQFYKDVVSPACALAPVSWFVPDGAVSEHPSSDIIAGMQYVTGLVNAIMNSPCGYWGNTAIFITWDDWGGFADHVVPPVGYAAKGTRYAYGIRVPGLIISSWAKAGYIDHQNVSFDAYIKFSEDLFLNSAGIGGSTGERPDSRPLQRERITSAPTQTGPGTFHGPSVPIGDLLNDFDFTRQLPALVLPTDMPNDFTGTSTTSTTTLAFPLKWSPPSNTTVVGYDVYRTTTSGSGYQPVSGCTNITATSCTDSAAVKGQTYFYGVRTVEPNGVLSNMAGEAELTP